jgi:uncharacterized membrane protein YeaQ/YmgE (transglycosylase-associated protein family)
MSFIGFVIAGLVIGAIAKLLMPGRDPGGILVTMLIGMAGALLAGWAGRALGFYGPEDVAGWISSIVGAIVLLAVYRATLQPRTTGI